MHLWDTQWSSSEERKMDRGRIIGGVVCLLVGLLLIVLNFALSPEKLMFMIGGRNMPMVPAIGLVVLGVILLTTAVRR